MDTPPGGGGVYLRISGKGSDLREISGKGSDLREINGNGNRCFQRAAGAKIFKNGTF